MKALCRSRGWRSLLAISLMTVMLFSVFGLILACPVNVPSGSTQSFTFTPTGSGYTTPFNLTDAATPNDSGWLVPGTYTVTEGAVTGWDLTSVTEEGSPFANGGDVILVAGDIVHLDFTNTQRRTIVIVKNTRGGNGTFECPAAGLGFLRRSTSQQAERLNGTASQTYTDLQPGAAGGSRSIGTHVIDSDAKLMAAFWANVVKASAGAKRSALDQARMQLMHLQQHSGTSCHRTLEQQDRAVA